MRRRERRCYGEKIIAEVARVRKQFWRLTNFKKETKTMNIKKNFLSAFALSAIILAFSAVAFGQDETTRTQFSLYGMHFVSAGQTVRIWVQNPRFSDSEIIPCIRVRVVFDIYEQNPAEPVRLRFVRRVSREIELEPGDAATFNYEAERTGDWVSPAVFASPEENNPPDTHPIRLVPTVAVQQGGRTLFNLPAVQKAMDPTNATPR